MANGQPPIPQRHRFTAGSPGEKKAFKSCGPMGTDGHQWVPGETQAPTQTVHMLMMNGNGYWMDIVMAEPSMMIVHSGYLT